jgi:hypothetical protein
VARVERVDHYELIPPIDRGVLDAPGAIVRVLDARVRGRQGPAFAQFVRSKHDELLATRLMLGFQFGRRIDPSGEHVTGVSSWSDSLTRAQAADPGWTGGPLFSVLPRFLEEMVVEEYEAIPFDLPQHLHHRGGRRILGARFLDEAGARTAVTAIRDQVRDADEPGLFVDTAGSTGQDGGDPGTLLVVRVMLRSAARVERIIRDTGGDLLPASGEAPGDVPGPSRGE